MLDEDGNGQGRQGDGRGKRPSFAELLLSFPAEVGEIERDTAPPCDCFAPFDAEEPDAGVTGQDQPA